MRVAAIVPAYNEERTIGQVIEALLKCSDIDEIIVVSDGSIDQTVQIARKYPIKVLDLAENIGKGGALKAGSRATDCPILLFIDADLVGLSSEHIAALIKPVLSNQKTMSIGVFSDGRRSTDLAQKIAPSLSGQRALMKELFDAVPKVEHSRFGVEVALTQYAEKVGIEICRVQLPFVSQVLKEEKRGFLQGFCDRLKMYWDIARSFRF